MEVDFTASFLLEGSTANVTSEQRLLLSAKRRGILNFSRDWKVKVELMGMISGVVD